MDSRQLNTASNWPYRVLIAVIIGLLTILHSGRLAEIPQGLYVDETSVGLNAALIAETGVDEHGESLPIFFKAFGEYKNPVYIYSAAALFYLFGPSVWLLRFTSVLYFAVFLIAFTLLAQRVFRSRLITLFLLFSAGTLPWFFPLSRISFEGMVSQLTLATAGLLFVHYAFHSPERSRIFTVAAALAGGLCWGLSAYTYSTARLLAFACAGMIVVVYAQRKTLGQALTFALSFAATLIPFAWYGYQHPGDLTDRFKIISYVYNTSLSLGDKIQEFIIMYARHFSPEFLIQMGDSNLRHNTGYGGVIFKVIFALLLLGIFALLKRPRKLLQDRFRLLVLALLFIAPSAAALTTGDSAQTLRGLLMGLPVLLLAGYGLWWVQKSPHRLGIMAVLLLVLTVEAGFYLHHYFTKYPETTRVWFETYGLEPALKEAVKREPTKLFVEPTVHQIITSVNFYTHVIPGLADVPVAYEPPTGEAGTCAISFYVESGLPAPVEIIIPGSPVKLRCY